MPVYGRFRRGGIEVNHLDSPDIKLEILELICNNFLMNKSKITINFFIYYL